MIHLGPARSPPSDAGATSLWRICIQSVTGFASCETNGTVPSLLDAAVSYFSNYIHNRETMSNWINKNTFNLGKGIVVMIVL